MIAYCYASGHIKFGRVVPDGAIEMARGPAARLRSMIVPTSRIAYDGKTLLVPGVPEAPSGDVAVDALGLHLRWLKRREVAGVRINTQEPPLSHPLNRRDRALVRKLQAATQPRRGQP